MKIRIFILSVLILTFNKAIADVVIVKNPDGTVTKQEIIPADKIADIVASDQAQIQQHSFYIKQLQKQIANEQAAIDALQAEIAQYTTP